MDWTRDVLLQDVPPPREHHEVCERCEVREQCEHRARRESCESHGQREVNESHGQRESRGQRERESLESRVARDSAVKSRVPRDRE